MTRYQADLVPPGPDGRGRRLRIADSRPVAPLAASVVEYWLDLPAQLEWRHVTTANLFGDTVLSRTRRLAVVAADRTEVLGGTIEELQALADQLTKLAPHLERTRPPELWR